MALPLHIGGYTWLDWNVHADVIILCLGLLAAYWYAVTVWRPQIPDAGRVKRSQAVSYVLGVAVIYIAAGSPIHEIAENYLLSVHMFQHMLLSLVAPPLLLAGVPTWLWEALFLRPGTRSMAGLVLHPLIAIGAFNMVLVITHLPHVVDYTLTHHWFHFWAHVLIIVTSLMMWWPIMTNVPRLPHLTYPYQMAYLFVQSLLPAVIGGFIVFSRSPVYDFYAEAPRIWGLSPLEDQQFGAFIMKVVGSLILWGFIGVAFFKWYEKEEAEARGLPWPEVEEELRELGLTHR